VSGLPVMWFGERKKLVKSLKGKHQFTWGKKQRSITIHKIVTTPQPFGGFYAHYLNDRGAAIYPEEEMLRTFGFLDIGWNTTDLTAIKGLQPVERWSRGERVGVRNIIETVGDVISRRYDMTTMEAHEIDEIVRLRRVEVYGQYHDIGHIIDSATTSLAQQIVAVATGLWGNGERMSRILIFGGGAAIMGQAIRQAFPRNGVVLSNPALANAIGSCFFAQRDIF
ncbi:MAG: ParM/StbA family protein, partial [bacterium]|nr:ParM/StbA family protein [bacterium]